ncbi:hypothetical protein EDB19DRAFT_2040432 [Suillus lakei]|nr:hypothetical protein EDB19DRAFT_2040432 [Suillus lakei]
MCASMQSKHACGESTCDRLQRHGFTRQRSQAHDPLETNRDVDERYLSGGFFGGTWANVHNSATPGARPTFFALLGRFPPLLRRSRPNETLETQHLAVSSESRSHALLNHLSSLLHRSRPNETIETQQSPVPSESRSHALLNRLSSLLHSSQNTDEISEHPQPPMLSRLRPQVLLGHLSSLLPRSRLHTSEVNELQQSQTPSGSRPGALIGLLSSLFRSPPNANEGIELQQWPRQSTSSHCSPRVVEVPAMRDREVIFVARRPETASEQARRIKNPKPWVRVVLFLCCVSPGTDDSPGTNATPRST